MLTLCTKGKKNRERNFLVEGNIPAEKTNLDLWKMHFDGHDLFFTAFDMVKDPFKSLDVIIQLGFERILTSGQDSSALEGLPTIKYLIEKVISGRK